MPSLPHRLRAASRGAALGWVLATAAAAAVFLPRDAGARARWQGRTARRLLRVLRVRLTSTGTPLAGEIIVANHVSTLDILVLAASRPVVFVAKREVRSWPVFGWLAWRAGARFLDRERRGDVARVAAEFAGVVAGGQGVVLFLEGTSSDGRAVLPFKPSLLAPAVATGWRIVPAALAYGVPPGHDAAREVCFWGDMELGPHLAGLPALPRIEAFVAWGAPEAAVVERKALARLLHERVSGLHAALLARTGTKERVDVV